MEEMRSGRPSVVNWAVSKPPMQVTAKKANEKQTAEIFCDVNVSSISSLDNLEQDGTSPVGQRRPVQA
jgi:hypothetical protein